MTLNSSPNNNKLSTTNAAVHEKPAGTIKKYYPNISKKIKIQLQKFLLMMMINNLRHPEAKIIVTVYIH